MELVITRSQDGQPVVFKVEYQLSLSDDERALSDRYGFPQPNEAFREQGVTGALLQGTLSKSGSQPADLRKHEQKIRDYCQETADYWRAAAAYQGADIVVFDVSPGTTP